VRGRHPLDREGLQRHKRDAWILQPRRHAQCRFQQLRTGRLPARRDRLRGGPR
jgi:hypothetical protein